jgi:hypothetical protein
MKAALDRVLDAAANRLDLALAAVWLLAGLLLLVEALK